MTHKPFAFESYEGIPPAPSLWDHEKSMRENILASRPEFVAVDGKKYPITVQFASEEEFNTLYLWSGEGKGDKNKICATIKNDPAIQHHLQLLGVSIKQALDMAAKFTPLDCMMFDIHHAMLGKIQFDFGPDCHGRGYYDSPGGLSEPSVFNNFNQHGYHDHPVSEIRIPPLEAAAFLERHNELLETWESIAKQYQHSFLANSNHLNFSFWIPNDGTFARHKQALSKDGQSVNLFVLANYDDQAYQFIQDTLARIVAVFNETVSKSITLGTSRANTFRLCKNRCEYRGGKGVHENMPHLVLSIIKAVEFDKLAHVTNEEIVKKKTGCNISFKDHVLDNPDSRHFTRRMFEGAELIPRPDGGYSFSPHNDYYLHNPEHKVDKELFGTFNRRVLFEGSGALFSAEQIQSLFGMIILKDGKLDATEAVKWLRNHNPSMADAFAACIDDIASVDTYRTYGTDQFAEPIPKGNKIAAIKRALHSPVMRFVYGPATPGILGMIASEFFSCDVSEGADIQKQIRQFKHAFTTLLKSAPPDVQSPFINAVKKRIDDAIYSINAKIKFYVVGGFPAITAAQTLDPADSDFLRKMKDCVATDDSFRSPLQDLPYTPELDYNIVQAKRILKDFDRADIRISFLKELSRTVDAVMRDAGHSSERVGR